MTDYLKNRNLAVKLGPFDGLVAAIVKFKDIDYLVTTHLNYIPELPLTLEHDVFLRQDLRYGPDDYTQWPQQYNHTFCHLANIRTKDAAKSYMNIMWWDPVPEDFCSKADGRTITQELGRLAEARLRALSRAVYELLLDYRSYVADVAEKTLPAPLKPLMTSLVAAMERLQALPNTYERTVLAVRNVQRTFLEIDAILEYMRMYKPYMEDPLSKATRPAALIGAYTTDSGVAQQLHRADIPYWYIRPASLFRDENILELVHPRPPTRLELRAHPDHTTLCRSTNNTAKKIAAIHDCSRSVRWYNDPFAIENPLEEGEVADTRTHPAEYTVASSSSASMQACGSASRPVQNVRADRSSGGGPTRTEGARHQRYSPYKPDPRGVPHAPAQSSGRNKFEVLDRPEMPTAIQCWKYALSKVNTSSPPHKKDSYYVLPEPAILVSAEAVGKRQRRLHHFLMLRDALLYRFGNYTGREILMSSQEWRDIMDGKVDTQGRAHSKLRERTAEIHRILKPAMQACNVDYYRDFPAKDDIPLITTNRAKEILWEISEINFRFEFVALDHRESELFRPEACLACFPDGGIVGFPLTASKLGFAAEALIDRHPYTLRLATLMLDWKNWKLPAVIRYAPTVTSWSKEQMETLESEVALHYTQCFFQSFGRACVIPMRLEHV
ncbi:hypothetical protein C8R47DRAFT_1328794 [Mycena vitilis]|nr:hypothetical protein C8R47DRAFT_1329025 [Mycena vitilis]KAJ6456004.1 hypothetical protein C8R47DRAFT_1328794 [Mycena vitilis]